MLKSAYDRLVAGVAGALKDSTEGSSSGVQAEIFDDARFERLEAEGRREFADQIAQLRKLLRGR